MKDDTLPQCNTLAFLLVLVGYTSLYKLYYNSSLLQGERQACFAVHYAAQQVMGPATGTLVSACCVKHRQPRRPIYFGLLVVDKEILGKLAIGLNIDLKPNISIALAVQGSNNSLYCVTLRPGVRLDVRFLGVASVLGLLLLPLAMQVCGKRVFGVT